MKCNAPGNYTKGRKHPNSEDRQRVAAAMLKYAMKNRGKIQRPQQEKEDECGNLD